MAVPSPPPHSYIVLKVTPKVDRGELREYNHKDGYYYSHSHGMSMPYKYRRSRLEDQDVAALTEEECIILDGIGSLADRYTVYSTPGKLAWGVGLKVGDTVLAQLPRRGSSAGVQYTAAVIRWAGVTWHSGHRFGVEITVGI